MKAATDPNELILIADPRVLSIPVIENGEPLIDIREDNQLWYGPSPEIANNTVYTRMRKTVYDKLLSAQSLLPKGIRLCLYEGYRDISLQLSLFNERMSRVKHAHPNWSEEDQFSECIRLVSPVVNLDGSANVPPHATGAAIDVYLVDESKNPLDMGIHPADWMSDQEVVLSATDCPSISDNAKNNRAMMSRVLQEVGFVNYPTEYWHWSYGDKYWAYVSGSKHALYAIVEL